MPAVPSFPDVWVTGAVHHYVRIPGDAEPFYLGTAEVTPQVQNAKYRQPVFNDIGGKTLPFQKTYDGEASRVSVLLTRHSRTAWERALVAGANSDPVGLLGKANPVSGTEGRWSRGHLVYGQSSFELWQVFDNSLNPNFPQADFLELGRYWPLVTLENHDLVAQGTQAEKLLMVFDCQPKWVTQASSGQVNAAANERGWVLFRFDAAAFPDSVKVPQ